MAKLERRLAHNAPGALYVDSTCIDCDTCRWMAPEVFVRREGQASVAQQPADEAQWLRAQRALLSCPTASIGDAQGRSLAAAQASLPDPVDAHGGLEVLHCGYHGEGSFGAAAYLVRRPAGNVLVDSPRFTRPLVQRVEQLGGVSTMFLTHRDDVLDHARWAAHFGCERVLHAAEVRAGTRDVERTFEGEQPFDLAPDLRVLPTPGHTEGSSCLLVAERWLFTGDHLAFSARLGHLIGFRSACWFDWATLVRSTEGLRGVPFEWVLPGHGRRFHAPAQRMDAELERALEWMRA